jgi:hypothetical protein
MKYKAVFEVPATVRVEVLVDESNQQAGLIAAHDLVGQARPETAVVATWRPDEAINVSFENVSQSMAPAGAPCIPEIDGFKVEFFDNKERSGTPLHIFEAGQYDKARDLAERIIHMVGPYAASQVRDATGAVVLTANCSRGGYEVECYDEANTIIERYSWLVSLAEAKSTALLALNRQAAYVVIYDYTDRKAGPRKIRTIR